MDFDLTFKGAQDCALTAPGGHWDLTFAPGQL